MVQEEKESILLQKAGVSRIEWRRCFRKWRPGLLFFLCLRWHFVFSLKMRLHVCQEKLSKLQSKCKKSIGELAMIFHSTGIPCMKLWWHTHQVQKPVMWHWQEKNNYVILFCISDPWKCSLQANHCHCQGSNILFQFLSFCLDMIEKERKWKRHITGNVNNKNFHSIKMGGNVIFPNQEVEVPKFIFSGVH